MVITTKAMGWALRVGVEGVEGVDGDSKAVVWAED